MAESQKRSSNLLQFALIFAVVYLGTQIAMRAFFPQKGANAPTQGGVELSVGNMTVGNAPVVTVKNSTASGITLVNRCPEPPLDVYAVEGVALTNVTSKETVTPCEPPPAVPAGSSVQLNLAPWKYSVFTRPGTYEVRLPEAVKVPTGTATVKEHISARFTVSEPGFFTKLFRTFITKPFLNFLIFVASILPGHSLGLSIIILTIVVKLLLFIPTQHALEGQKKMQMLQPKLDELKKKYPKDPQKVQEETLRLWKEFKVNPLQSCLPTLVQFPVLIGLFYVVRDAGTLELSKDFIYPAYQHLSWTFNTHFFGLDLLKPNVYVMPALLVVLQFVQMKLAFAISDRKKGKQEVIDVKKGKDDTASATQTNQKVMLYLLPLMIGFFAIKFPAAVSVYWGVSTLFGIGQQIIVNREHLSVKA
jgi:YidC/Oxa1 family membrane protein insertase